MLKRTLLLFLVGGIGWFGPADVADANTCRSLAMQRMMFQASRETAQYHRVGKLMMQQGCIEANSSVHSWMGRQPPITRTRPQAARRTRGDANDRSAPGISIARGTFRTLCVRSCDGYYFPISFSTTRDHFAADQEICSRACPEAEARIYYHAALTQGPESMVSLDGTSYSDLPAAFLYRSNLDRACSCGRPHSAAITLANAGANAADAEFAAPPPQPRPAPGEDPETMANRRGGFVPRPIAPAVAAGDDFGRSPRVRIVAVDEPTPVLMSPVPNDLETSLLWEASRRTPSGPRAGAGGTRPAAAATPSTP